MKTDHDYPQVPNVQYDSFLVCLKYSPADIHTPAFECTHGIIYYTIVRGLEIRGNLEQNIIFELCTAQNVP